MKAAPFRYHAPRSVGEVVALLARHDNARVLAGGQSLMPMMNLRVASPDHLIDLGHVSELAGIEDRGATISIGAMTTQRAVERSSLIRAHCPLLAQAIDCVGHQQTRNRGTIGGSLCHLDPGAELPVVAMAIGAELTIAGPSGERKLPFSAFPTGYLSVALESDEILTRIEIPKATPDERSAFLEFNRRPADFAIVSVAVRVLLAAGGRNGEATIVAGGVSHAPIRLGAVEDVLRGQLAATTLFDTAAATIADLECDGDDLYPADFRREICAVLIRRALRQAMGWAGGNEHA